MKKLRLFQHTSLDGFVAGPNGEMDFIKTSEELFDITNHYSTNSDTYILGRKTFEMMEWYWPTAGQQPNATKHDKAHSEWYIHVAKIVISNTLAPKQNSGTRVINKNLKGEI